MLHGGAAAHYRGDPYPRDVGNNSSGGSLASFAFPELDASAGGVELQGLAAQLGRVADEMRQLRASASGGGGSLSPSPSSHRSRSVSGGGLLGLAMAAEDASRSPSSESASVSSPEGGAGGGGG